MKDYMRGASTQNKRGEWVPAIPEPYFLYPFFVGRLMCWPCGVKFWTRKGYDGHYALEHILGFYEETPTHHGQ